VVRIAPGSDRAAFALLMHQLFRTTLGKKLRQHLELEVLAPLSCINPSTGALLGDRETVFAEGHKALAKKLLDAADVDARMIAEDNEQGGPNG
jgi:hypothetical protein